MIFLVRFLVSCTMLQTQIPFPSPFGQLINILLKFRCVFNAINLTIADTVLSVQTNLRFCSNHDVIYIQGKKSKQQATENKDPAAHQTKGVPNEILLHWLQPFVAYCTETNQSILRFTTYAISMEFAFQKFMRRSVKGLLEVQYECIYLTSKILAQSLITVINWVS